MTFGKICQHESLERSCEVCELEADVAALTEALHEAHNQLREARDHLRVLQRNAIPTYCERCVGSGCESPGCPEDGPCERCGGWTTHKRLVAAQPEEVTRQEEQT